MFYVQLHIMSTAGGRTVLCNLLAWWWLSCIGLAGGDRWVALNNISMLISVASVFHKGFIHKKHIFPPNKAVLNNSSCQVSTSPAPVKFFSHFLCRRIILVSSPCDFKIIFEVYGLSLWYTFNTNTWRDTLRNAHIAP